MLHMQLYIHIYMLIDSTTDDISLSDVDFYVAGSVCVRGAACANFPALLNTFARAATFHTFSHFSLLVSCLH